MKIFIYFKDWVGPIKGPDIIYVSTTNMQLRVIN